MSNPTSRMAASLNWLVIGVALTLWTVGAWFVFEGLSDVGGPIGPTLGPTSPKERIILGASLAAIGGALELARRWVRWVATGTPLFPRKAARK